MYSQRPFKWYMTRLPKLKISWRRGKQYTSPVALGGRHNYPQRSLLAHNKLITLLYYYGQVKTFRGYHLFCCWWYILWEKIFFLGWEYKKLHFFFTELEKIVRKKYHILYFITWHILCHIFVTILWRSPMCATCQLAQWAYLCYAYLWRMLWHINGMPHIPSAYSAFSFMAWGNATKAEFIIIMPYMPYFAVSDADTNKRIKDGCIFKNNFFNKRK